MSYHRYCTQPNHKSALERSSVHFEFQVENADDEYESWELATAGQLEGGDEGEPTATPEGEAKAEGLPDDDFENTAIEESTGKMFFSLMRQFIPGTCCQITLMLSEVVNLLFIGQLNDPNILAGVGMGNCIQNMCGYSIVVGLNGALETLVSQAYGAKDFDRCGLYLNRGRFVLLLTFSIVFCILSHTEMILIAINQDPKVAKYSQEYVLAYLPGLIMAGLMDGHRRFLNMMNVTQVPLFCLITGVFIHIGCLFIFINKCNYGIQGLGYAGSIANITVYLAALSYTFLDSKLRPTMKLPDRRTFALDGIWEYYRIGIPNAIMSCFEWWAYEVMTLLAGYISVDAQAAQVVTMNLVALMFMIALGMQQAVGSHVG